MKMLKVKLVKSRIGCNKNQIATLDALKLKKINSERIYKDTPSIRGMINSVSHMLSVEEVKQ